MPDEGAKGMDISRFGEHDILLTFEEVAQLLRVSRATMYRLLGSGQLTGHKVGRGWRFYKTDVHRFVSFQAGTGNHASTSDELVDVDRTSIPQEKLVNSVS